jgi:hypothetical protein
VVSGSAVDGHGLQRSVRNGGAALIQPRLGIKGLQGMAHGPHLAAPLAPNSASTVAAPRTCGKHLIICLSHRPPHNPPYNTF